MHYSFEYIDIILLAMIAGFIFLRLRGILGKRTGFDGKAAPQFQEILKKTNPKNKSNIKDINTFFFATTFLVIFSSCSYISGPDWLFL